MRKKLIIVLLFILAFHVCVSAQTSKFNPPDPRLEKKVTLDVNHVQLQEVAKTLTEQSGVTVQAGTGTRDWKVRETRVSVEAKDATLESVLNEITRLLGFYLSREGKPGEFTYIIWQDKKSRELESEMIVSQKEAAAKRIKDAREAAMNNADKALKMTPEEAMKLKDKDPMTAYLGGTKSGRAFAQIMASMSSYFPTEFDLMMRGKRSFIPVAGLPAGLRTAVGDALNSSFGRAFRDQGGKEPGELAPYQIVMMPTSDIGMDRGADMLGMNNLMFITGLKEGQSTDGMFGGGRPMTMFPIADPGSTGAALFGEAMLAVEAGEPLDEVGKRLEPRLNDPSVMQKSLAKESPTEKNPPTDPVLTREVEIIKENLGPSDIGRAMARNGNKEGQDKTLAELNRAIGWDVYLESFTISLPLSIFITSGKQPLYKVLIAVEKAGYKWERGDKTLRIRPENWALKRSYAIPDSYIAYYKDLMEKQGYLTLDDAAAIASELTDEQIQNTFLTDPDVMFLFGTLGNSTMGGSRSMLRLYASLDQNQKAVLSSDTGLPFDMLSDVQWNQMNDIITEKSGGIYVVGGSVHLVPLTEKEIADGVQRRTFETSVIVQGEAEPKKSSLSVYLPGKNEIAGMIEARKKAEEQAKAAQAKPGETQQKNDTQTPAPELKN